MSFLSDSLPAPWDFLALLKILLSPPSQDRSSLLSYSASAREVPVEEVTGGAACCWDMLPSAAPLPHSETHWILPDKDFI